MTYLALPTIVNYTTFADPKKKFCNHGGIAAYVKNCFASNIFDLSYNECYVSFRLDIAPTYLFGGVYINPENSKYFTPEMFAELDSLLVRCDENDYIPYIGGDFNSRLGDFNLLCSSCHYESNVDKTTNSHGRIFMADICKRNNVYPLNHLQYKGVSYDGDFTYYKNEKMSQMTLFLRTIKGKMLNLSKLWIAIGIYQIVDL